MRAAASSYHMLGAARANRSTVGGLAFLGGSHHIPHQPKHKDDLLPRGFWTKAKDMIWRWGHWALGDISMHLGGTAHGTTAPPKGMTRWSFEFRLVIMPLRPDTTHKKTLQRTYIEEEAVCYELFRQSPIPAPNGTAEAPPPTKRRRTTKKNY